MPVHEPDTHKGRKGKNGCDKERNQLFFRTGFVKAVHLNCAAKPMDTPQTNIQRTALYGRRLVVRPSRREWKTAAYQCIEQNRDAE